MRSIRREPKPFWLWGRFLYQRSVALGPGEAKTRFGPGRIIVPGNADLSGGSRKSPVFHGVGGEFMNGQRQRERLPGRQLQVGALDRDASLSGVRGERAFDDVLDRCAGPARLGQDIVRLAQDREARGKRLTRQADVVAAHGLIGDRPDHRQRVLDAMLEFLRQQRLPLQGIVQVGNRPPFLGDVSRYGKQMGDFSLGARDWRYLDVPISRIALGGVGGPLEARQPRRRSRWQSRAWLRRFPGLPRSPAMDSP